MTVQTMPIFSEGETVVSNSSGRTYKILKVNPVNLLCIDETGRRYKVPQGNARHATTESFTAPPEPTVIRIPLGTVVRLTGSDARRFGDFAMVCIKELKPGRVRIVRLNGGNLLGGHASVDCPTEALTVTVVEGV